MENVQVIPSQGGGMFPLVTPVLPGKTAVNAVASGFGVTFAELLGTVAFPELDAAADGATGGEAGTGAAESISAEDTVPAEKGEGTESSFPTVATASIPLMVPVTVQQIANAVQSVQAPIEEQKSVPVPTETGGLQVQAVVDEISAQPLVQTQKDALTAVKTGPVQENAVKETPVVPLQEKAPLAGKRPEDRQDSEVINASPTVSTTLEGAVTLPSLSLDFPETEPRAAVTAPMGERAANAGKGVQPAPVLTNAASVSAAAAVPPPATVTTADVVPEADAVQGKEAHSTDGMQLDTAEAEPSAAMVAAPAEVLRGRETVLKPVQEKMITKPGDALPETAGKGGKQPGDDAMAEGQKAPSVLKSAAKPAATDPGDGGMKPAMAEKAMVAHHQLAPSGEAVQTPAFVEPIHKGEAPAPATTAESILSQVRETLAQHNPREAKQITMTLHPAELGELKIHVSMDGQRLKVEVTAENVMVKDVLMANLDSLKESLSKQNVSMERFNVSTGGSYGFDQHSADERWVPQNRSFKNYPAMGAAYVEGEERKVSYLTGTGTGLVDVRF
ncbi:flagellar hook-length control protein FliK [Geotalea sp. SG265]|uniref:flagellar hook-length control protein FliK n=1 Tax=Geotalea sp. SG265 TaxID=2922867 RepID=UPI001FAFE81C|nr:flagellar hook-length control protein FliK [Geotalea sp. SG265]